MAPTPSSLSSDIDALLVRYLLLLEQYTTLRAELTHSQTSFHQHLARANFSSSPTTRYGADQYSNRMQAASTCVVTPAATTPENSTAVPTEKEQAKFDIERGDGDGKEALRMFAALPPLSLREAQGEARGWVGLVARLVEVEREMGEVEIRVRRARKYLGREREREKEEVSKENGKRGGVNDEVDGEDGIQKIVGAMRDTAVY